MISEHQNLAMTLEDFSATQHIDDVMLKEIYFHIVFIILDLFHVQDVDVQCKYFYTAPVIHSIKKHQPQNVMIQQC